MATWWKFWRWGIWRRILPSKMQEAPPSTNEVQERSKERAISILEDLRWRALAADIPLSEIPDPEPGPVLFQLKSALESGISSPGEKFSNLSLGSNKLYLIHDPHYKKRVEEIRELLREENLTLKDCGSSEEELDELTRQNAILTARYWLETQREVHAHGDYDKRWRDKKIREHLGIAGATLEDINSSEKELDKLFKQNALEYARHVLSRLRESSVYIFDFNYYHKLFLEALENAGSLAPQDIDSSEEELNELFKRSALATARMFLQKGILEDDSTEQIEGHYSSGKFVMWMFLNQIKEWIAKGYFTYQDLGFPSEGKIHESIYDRFHPDFLYPGAY